MKIPFRLLFGLVLGVALGYGLTLLARPAASRRARTPKPRRRVGEQERESVH